MIRLTDINVTFNDNCVFRHASFTAKDNSITMIAGESGSGKSTLLHTLLFHHHCKYFYNDKDISSLDAEEQHIFIQQKIGIVYQSPSFLPSLTIKEHISMFIHLYHIKELHKGWSALLDIHSLLNKYPSQLSGGEKTRAALYLALLKEPEILILDEPTASLDKNNKNNAIQILKEYAHQYHKTVIVSTHDQTLMQEADALYQIENHLIQLRKSRDRTDFTIEEKHISVHYEALNSYIKTIRKHDKLHDKVLRILLSCTLGFLMVALSLNNSSISQAKEMINQMASREFYVYKPLMNDREYSFGTVEYPISENDLESIKKTDGIERIEWRFNTMGSSTSIGVISNEIYHNESASFDEAMETIVALESDHIKTKKRLQYYYQNTYIDDYDYGKAIAKTYHDSGIYISADLFSELFDEDTIDPYIRFQLMVPLYDSTGLSRITDEETSEVTLTNLTSCQYVEVTMPVKGVLTENILSHELNYNYQIYISQSDLLHYINQFEIPENRTAYYSDATDMFYFDTYPKEIIPKQTVRQTKWKPNSYSVTVKELDDLESVVRQLKKNGFAVSSNYFQTSNIIEVNESLKQTMSMVGTIIIVILLALYAFVKFINRRKYQESDRFLTMLGCTKKQKQSFYRNLWLCNWRDQFLIAILFYFITRFAIMKSNLAVIRPDPILLIVIALFSFFIEYICPKMLNKRG